MLDRLRRLSYLAWAIIAGALLAIAGIVLIWISTQLKSDAAPVVLSNVGTVVLTTGILGLTYDAFLRKRLTDEILIESEVSSSLLAAGIRLAAVEPGAEDYRTALSDTQAIRILPLDPLRWASQHMQTLLDLVRDKDVKVTIYLPAPAIYANVLGLCAPESPGAGERNCVEIARDISMQWKQATGLARSTLSIVQFEGFPHTGIALGDQSLILSVASPPGPRRDARSATFLFRGKRKNRFYSWAEEVLAGLPNQVPIELTVDRSAVRTPAQILPLQEEDRGHDTAPDEHQSNGLSREGSERP